MAGQSVLLLARGRGMAAGRARYSSYLGSGTVGPLSQYTGVEISKDPQEWRAVERLLPTKYIPEPAAKPCYPSGWKPLDRSSLNLPYFVQRSRNHMPPIYLKIVHRGQLRFTTLKNIQGDIQQLNLDLSHFLERRGAPFVTQVNEMQAFVRVKGDLVGPVTEWFLSRGF